MLSAPQRLGEERDGLSPGDKAGMQHQGCPGKFKIRHRTKMKCVAPVKRSLQLAVEGSHATQAIPIHLAPERGAAGGTHVL